MYLTQETVYAVRIVYCLAKSAARKDAASLGAQMSVTLRFSLKILGKLSTAGIVKSFKGTHGGYELARAPALITLKDIVDAVEGEPYAISRCISEGGECNRGASGCCAFQHHFSQISASINEQLSAVNFADLLSEESARQA
ncbi:MAG: Rrf2 family transcriptional regulator [Pygmaiobacter sp.]